MVSAAGGAGLVSVVDVVFSLNLPLVQVRDWENHFKISPHQIAIMQMELLEFPQLAVLCSFWVHGFAQKLLEVHDARLPIVKRQVYFVA
jgi:hypothetical protein